MTARPQFFNTSTGVVESLPAGTALDLGTGGLNVGGNIALSNSAKITGMGAGTQAGDAARYEQVLLRSGVNAMSADLAMGDNQITGLGSPSAATDAASKQYVDGVAQGLSVKRSVKAATQANLVGTRTLSVITAGANGAFPTVDGITITTDGSAGANDGTEAASDRVLVKNQTADVDNGVYFLSDPGDGSNPWKLTRCSDADEQSDDMSGAFMFVEQGTVDADTGWVCTGDGDILPNTHDMVFTQFSGAGSYTGGDGVAITGTSVAVDLGTAPGLLFNAGKLLVKTKTNGGVTLDADGLSATIGSGDVGVNGSGQLYVPDGALDNDHINASAGIVDTKLATLATANKVSGSAVQLGTNPGIEDSTGLKIKIGDSNTLSLDGDGLAVDGVPTTFNIGATAVGAAVTAPNLDTLTDVSQADSLHTHGQVQNKENFTADTAGVTADTAVRCSTASKVVTAACDTAANARIIGVAPAAATSGNPALFVAAGYTEGVTVAGTPSINDPVFLQSNGTLSSVQPSTAGHQIVRVGFYCGTNAIFVQIAYLGTVPAA
jgi:hypothetical protein